MQRTLNGYGSLHRNPSAAPDLYPDFTNGAGDNYRLLPTAEVVPFSLLFESNQSIKEVLKEIVHQETRPLSAQQVTELLQARGSSVARRTVAK